MIMIIMCFYTVPELFHALHNMDVVRGKIIKKYEAEM